MFHVISRLAAAISEPKAASHTTNAFLQRPKAFAASASLDSAMWRVLLALAVKAHDDDMPDHWYEAYKDARSGL